MATPRYISDLVGTLQTYFRIGSLRLKNDSTALAVRDQTDAAWAPVKAASMKLQGSSSGETILQVASSTAGTYTLPSADGSSGDVLSTNGAGALSWTAVATGSNMCKAATEEVLFGTSSPIVVFTPPANAKIERIVVDVDTAFNGTANMSVGVAGGTSRYAGTADFDLLTAATYEVAPMYEEDGSPDEIIITYSAGSADQGAAHVTVYYSNPS